MRFTTDFEVKTLQEYVSAARHGVVEIGLMHGETTKELLQVCKVPYYGIDPLIPDSMNAAFCGTDDLITKNCRWSPLFAFIKGFSYDVVRLWEVPVDFVFLDGDHRYGAVSTDFCDWWKILSPGGAIAIHDTAPIISEPSTFKGHTGPTQLAAELRRGCKGEGCDIVPVGIFDSISIFKKADL